MFAVLGFILGFWLLISPGRRLFGLTGRDDSRVPLLEASSHMQIMWMAFWFTFSMLGSFCWILFYHMASSQYSKVQHADDVSWLWPDETALMWILMIVGFATNLGWLIWLCFIDCKMTLLWSSLSTVSSSVLIYTCYALCNEGPTRLQIIGWAAVFLSVMGNFFRITSMGRRRELSFFSFFVAISGTFPEGLWMLNVIFLEWGTVFDIDGRMIGFWDIFFKRNCHWKASWTLNCLLRLPELKLLALWAFEDLSERLHCWVWTSASAFLRKNGQQHLVEG